MTAEVYTYAPRRFKDLTTIWSLAEADRPSTSPRITSRSLETTAAPCATLHAVACIVETPRLDLITVARHHGSATTVPECRAVLLVVHVAGAGIVNTVAESDLTHPTQRIRRRAWLFHHFPIRMKSREVHGQGAAKF